MYLAEERIARRSVSVWTTKGQRPKGNTRASMYCETWSLLFACLGFGLARVHVWREVHWTLQKWLCLHIGNPQTGFTSRFEHPEMCCPLWVTGHSGGKNVICVRPHLFLCLFFVGPLGSPVFFLLALQRRQRPKTAFGLEDHQLNKAWLIKPVLRRFLFTQGQRLKR